MPLEEYTRLQKVLIKWARIKGYKRPLGDDYQGKFPDCVRLRSSLNDNSLFVSDSKVFKSSETPFKKETAAQMAECIEEFAKMIRSDFKGGIFAVATENSAAAIEWKQFLNNESIKLGLLKEEDKTTFEHIMFNLNSFIVYCSF